MSPHDIEVTLKLLIVLILATRLSCEVIHDDTYSILLQYLYTYRNECKRKVNRSYYFFFFFSSTCYGGDLRCETDRCMIDETVVENINLAQRQYGWTAANYSQFWGRKARDGLLYKTGTLNPEALVSWGALQLLIVTGYNGNNAGRFQ